MKRRFLVLCLFVCTMLVLCILIGCQKEATTTTAANASHEGMKNILGYYATDSGYIVPVMKWIPWEEGIGKAALRQLVNTEDNKKVLEEYGLKAVIPDGVDFELSIKDDGTAKCNLKSLKKTESLKAEKNMVTVIVNTLVEFTRIDKVQISVDGKSDKLPYGTSIKKVFEKQDLNAETASADTKYKLTLYFPSTSGNINIPVTRYFSSTPDIKDAINELIKGPVDKENLVNCFPEGTKLLDVNIAYGDAVINLSKEFENIMETPDLEQMAFDTLQLTCTQFANVDRVVIKTEGKAYESVSAQTIAYPVYANQLK